jgi:cytochrome c oxidase subunit 1
MFFMGGVYAMVIRLQLISPTSDLVSPETYNKMFSMHGITMVWFFLIPSIPTVLGNFLLPLMIGSRDLAFPRINLLSWYLFAIGCVFLFVCVITGGIDTGWTFYTPYSTQYSHTNVLFALFAVIIVGFSTILTAVNFIVTTHKLRAPGMTWFRLPLFVWALYTVSILMLLATPELAITLILTAFDRAIGIGIYDPGVGGDPILFQHMFWFYSHPAVYIMLLPAFGVVNELFPCYAHRRIFSYKLMAYSILALGLLTFFAWGHHMFVSGQSVFSSIIFSFMSFAVAVPSAIKNFNWVATLHKGQVRFDAPMLYAFSFVGLFVMGGVTGLMVASAALDVHLHATYFIIAHFHYIMVGGMVSAFIGGMHFWWPKITGRLYPEFWARIAAITTFIGFNLTFFPQYILGEAGMMRRYATYPPKFQDLNILSSAGASVLAIGYILPLFYFAWSLRYGKRAGNNPWDARGLEWTVSSPPPEHNFETTPIVDFEAYAYDKPLLGEATGIEAKG